MNKSIKNTAQAGFTLIELIVVIVILGILAATALPKFADMSADARVAALQGGRGAISSASGIAHGAWLINQGATVTLEGTSIAMVNGYPSATGIRNAANLDGFDVLPVAGAGANTPAVTATDFAIVPRGAAGTTTAATCFIMYSEAVNANTPPVITAAPTNANCG